MARARCSSSPGSSSRNRDRDQPDLGSGPGQALTALVQTGLDSACPDELRSLAGRGADALRPVVSHVHAQDRPDELPSRDQRDGAADQPAHRPQPDPAARAFVARRSGAAIGPAAQHRLGDHRRADRRGLGQRRRAGAAAQGPPAALPARQHRARRHHRCRAASRHHHRRPGRARCAVQGPGAMAHAGDTRGVRGPAGRDGRVAPRRSSRPPGSKASASACLAASTRRGA